MESKRIQSKVIMLPTDKAHELVINTYITKNHKTSPIQLRPDIKSFKSFIERGFEPQHLYFTTSGICKVGEWYVVPINHGKGGVYLRSSLAQMKETNSEKEFIEFGARKVVVSTDEALGLPKPSRAFLEKYVEVGGIEDVLIDCNETEWFNERFGGTWQPFPDAKATISRTTLKVDPVHNTVTIRPYVMTPDEFLQDHPQISHFFDDKTGQMVCFSSDVEKAMIEYAKIYKIQSRS